MPKLLTLPWPTIKQTSGKRLPDEPHYPDASKLSRLARTQAPARWHDTSYLALVGVGAMQHAMNDPASQSWQLGLDLSRKQASRTRVPNEPRYPAVQSRIAFCALKHPRCEEAHTTHSRGPRNQRFRIIPKRMGAQTRQLPPLWRCPKCFCFENTIPSRYDMSTIRDR